MESDRVALGVHPGGEGGSLRPAARRDDREQVHHLPLHPGARQPPGLVEHRLGRRLRTIEGVEGFEPHGDAKLPHAASERMRLVGHLRLERRPRLVEAPEVGERQPPDARVLDRERAELRRERDPLVAGDHAGRELSPSVVVPHEPEQMLLQAHGIAAGLEALAHAERLRVGLGERHQPQPHRRRLDLQLVVAELRGEGARLVVVDDRLPAVLLPVVGEPCGGDERLAHGALVADLLGQRVGLLVGSARLVRVARLVEGEDVEPAAAHEEQLDLARVIAGRARMRQERLEIGQRLAAAEEIEPESGARLQAAVTLLAGRRDLDRRRQGRQRVVDTPEAAEGARAQAQESHHAFAGSRREHGARLIEIAERVLEGEGVERPLGGAQQPAGRPLPRGRGTRLVEVVGDLRCEAVGVQPMERLEGVGHAQVESLAAGGGDEREQGLTDLLVHEGVAGLAIGGDVLDQGGARGLLERDEQVVRVDSLQRDEQVEGEGLAGDGRGGEDAATVGADPVQALADHQAHAARHFGVGDPDARVPAALRVEELARFVQMPEELLDEKGVALGFGEHERDHLGRRRAPGATRQDGGDVLLGQAPKEDLLGQPLAQERREHAGERPASLKLGVAIGPDRQHRDPRESLGHVLHEQQRRLVGPVEVLEHEEQRYPARVALDELAHAMQ